MRAANMQALTVDVLYVWPGSTVWGIGDPDHQDRPSDHNEDDTPGSRPAQTDADNRPEHRALDIKPAGATAAVRHERSVDLVRALIDPVSARRLRYVIYEKSIWSRSNGWRAAWYSGDFHNHVHVSGDAADDENTAEWPAVREIRDGETVDSATIEKIAIRTVEILLGTGPDADTNPEAWIKSPTLGNKPFREYVKGGEGARRTLIDNPEGEDSDGVLPRLERIEEAIVRIEASLATPDPDA